MKVLFVFIMMVLTACCTKAADVDCDSFASCFDSGKSYYEVGDFESAVIEFTKALEYDDTVGDVYYFRGNALLFEGERQRAIDDYEMVGTDWNGFWGVTRRILGVIGGCER